MPEARLNLGQAVIALALAPKSNAVITAVDEALADVRSGRIGPVPAHLRDAHYRGAGDIGHGEGYLYAHDDPRGVAPQRHAPAAVDDRTYYRPTGFGAEAQYAARLERIRAILAGD
jgi:putative ATPase